ncbi:MAG: glycosyltransferase [Candidatus Eisenbacteria bacterium]|nr:glycosyltransferase [Candidatus Latescibacterota bacterium]MBD3303067.1 glycosyltransferase [Candidatus Eisenbacteria bacterium]
MSGSRRVVTFYSDAAYYGGAEVYLSMLARHLDPERFRTTALLPDDPPVKRLEREMEAIGARVVRHPRPGLNWMNALRRMPSVFREIGGEILHINLPSTYDAAVSAVAVAARLAGYRRVLTTEHLPMIERKYRKFPAKLLFSEAIDLVLVPSRATREYVVQRHRLPLEKTRVLPYGIERPAPVDADTAARLRAETATPEGTCLIGIVGRLHPRKGHRTLFAALSCLRERARLEEVRVWVIGEGEDRPALERIVADRDLGGVVRFLGPRDDAAGLMQLLDLLVVPSLVETTPFVILEAMAAGRAVVASRIYGIPEMIEPEGSGLLIEPEDVAGLAEALGRLVSDPELRARFGARGRARFDERFTAARMARETEAAYLDRGGEGPE